MVMHDPIKATESKWRWGDLTYGDRVFLHHSEFAVTDELRSGFSESVGSLLAEASARDTDVDIHYYYYM